MIEVVIMVVIWVCCFACQTISEFIRNIRK